MALTQVQGGMLAGSTNTTTTIQSNGTTAITIDSSQNVGIGTASPSRRLTVSGKAQFTSTTSTNEIYLADSSTSTIDNQGIGSVGNNIVILAGGNERMRIDSSGRVTTPYQPAFMALKSSGNVSSGGTIPFGDVTFNTGSHYNASTYTFTAPIAGNYFFTLNVAVENSGGYTAYIVRNGTNFTGGEVASSGGWQQSTATCILPLAAGDTVYTRMVGSWTNVDAGQWTGFGGYLLG